MYRFPTNGCQPPMKGVFSVLFARHAGSGATVSFVDLLATLGGYREYAPPEDLRGILAAVWSYARPFGAPAIPAPGHRLVPQSEVSLSFVSRSDGEGRVVDAAMFFIGPIATPRFYDPEPGVTSHSVCFRPEWCRDLLGIDPAEHFNVVTPLAHARPRSEALDIKECADPVAFLLSAVRRLCDEGRASRDTRLAHEALDHLRADARLESVSRTVGICERHLRRVVRETTGFSPKRLQRIRRLAAVMIAADRHDQPDWARLAADHGFYDQPHLIQEFRAIADCLPSELHSDRRLQIWNAAAMPPLSSH
jgi:AraC-like DNA-binding protein